jgi:hypothetical protein
MHCDSGGGGGSARGSERSWLVVVALRPPQTYLDGRSRDGLRLAKGKDKRALGPWLYPHAYQAQDSPLALHTVSLSKGFSCERKEGLTSGWQATWFSRIRGDDNRLRVAH